MARLEGTCWTDPFEVASQPGVPLWNPVLFCDAGCRMWLFFKVGATVPAWTGVYITSGDGGQAWTVPVALPAGLLGPAKNKPILLSNGDILCGTSAETWRSWTCWVEISGDGGQTWSRHGPIEAPGEPGLMSGPPEPTSATWDVVSQQLVLPQHHSGVIQPAVWEYEPGRLKMLMRATQRVGCICMASSDDFGRTWSAASPTGVPCPNSGLDAVHLADGRIVLACNPTREGRTPLSLLAVCRRGSCAGFPPTMFRTICQ